ARSHVPPRAWPGRRIKRYPCLRSGCYRCFRLCPVELPRWSSAVGTMNCVWCPQKTNQKTEESRSAAKRDVKSHDLELLAHPVRHGGAVLVRDVVADVVSVRVHEQRRLGRLTGDALRLLRREEPVLRAVDDQERALHLVEDAAQSERLRLLERLVLVARLRIEDVAAPGERVQRRPAFGQVV